MPDKNLRGMTALSVFFGKFYCSAERLCFAWEICGFAIRHFGSSRHIAICETLPPNCGFTPLP
jgi:hypothetical protein